MKFHDHMLGHHKPGACYRCSTCDYAHRFRTKVNHHIRREKKTKGKSHSKARALLIHPVPADKYAPYQQTVLIKRGLTSGWMTDVPSSECQNVDDLTNNLEPQDCESLPSSECENFEDLTNNLEHDFESAPSGIAKGFIEFINYINKFFFRS